jgi:hypothetical protein
LSFVTRLVEPERRLAARQLAGKTMRAGEVARRDSLRSPSASPTIVEIGVARGAKGPKCFTRRTLV